MEELMIKIENVSKEYRLGQIGGTTLREELQRKKAKLLNKEDPTAKIGAKQVKNGEKFLALDGISFDVKKGERVGIIGHNGAGKSTLLKLLSRVTAPTGGEIGLNGRVASMLEVGTGFNGELTGRENIYMNGAILGMTKKEIADKIEDIIDFSECRQFIDTPVKRYSSGMYVKLAFAVAAHLNSEIMIMDEVLAVGDMAFQKKCLEKMNDVSRSEGRTILYVSHNMSTIRQLCDRVIVLDHGKLVFDGETEEGIGIYLGASGSSSSMHYDYPESFHTNKLSSDNFVMESLDILDENGYYNLNDSLKAKIKYSAILEYKDIMIRFVFSTVSGKLVATSMSGNDIDIVPGDNQFISVDLDLSHLTYGKYRVDIIAFMYDSLGNERVIDGVYPGFFIEIIDTVNSKNKIKWLSEYWGNVKLNDSVISKID